MNTRTRWMFIVGLTLVLTTLLLIPMTEAKRDSKSASSANRNASLRRTDKPPKLNLERGKESYASWNVMPPQSSQLKPVVSRAVISGLSQPARELSSGTRESDARIPVVGEGREINKKNRDIQREFAPGATTSDGALQKSIAKDGKVSAAITPNVIAGPSLVFEGLANTDNIGLVNPPDTVGAVGPNHYVQAVNNRFRVFNKAGVPLTPPLSQSSLFGSVYPQIGGICSTSDAGDPIVLYDRMADRFQISQFAFTSQTTPPYHQCIAVSQTSDPTGAWFVYDFVLPGNQFPDYPKLSTWPDAYYMSTRQFTNGGPFDGEGAFAFDRRAMLLGDPNPALIYFDLGSLSNSSSGMLPTDFDGILPPPPGTPNIFAIYTSNDFVPGDPQGDALRLFDFHADFANPGNSTFLERPESPITVAPFDARNPNGRADIEQPPPAVVGDGLDAIGDRLMFRLVYRNRDGVESLVANHTVNVSGVTPNTPANYQAAIRYYELRRSSPGPFSIHDQATFSPDAGNGATGLNRWMGAVAIDNSGNLSAGYSVSSTTAVPGIRYAGRSAGFTGGLDEGEATMFPGIGTQQASGNRWGDYSGLTVDPVDDCTFWYTNEYYPAGHTQFNWKSKVGKYTVASCTAPPQGMLMGTVTDCATTNPIGGILVEVAGGPSTGFSSATLANGTYSMNLSPGNYTVTFSGRSCGVVGPFNVTITDGGTATQNACVTGSPRAAFVSAAVSGGNGNGVIDHNECNMLNVTISNPGCGPLTGASAVLSSSTPGVTVTQPNSPYPNIPINGTGTNTVPFQVNTAADLMCGQVDFTLTVTSNEGTFTINFSLPSCSAVTGSGSITATDSQQTGRMVRNGVPSSCAAPKAFTGFQDMTLRRFDQYSFTNSGTAPACATFTVSNACANNLFYVTYLGSYNPAVISQNYHSDPGATSTTATWTAVVPAGQTVVLVIHEVTPNAGCGSYSFSVSGLPINDGGGACPVPIIAANGSTLVNESCPPANNAIDPGERVTVNFRLKNNGGASTSNLVATLQPTGGVVAPSGPQSYGAIPPGGTVGRDFSFTAAGNCGDTITATLQLQDGANNLVTVSYTFTLGAVVTTNVFSENFDGVPAPVLPAGWTTTFLLPGGKPWMTTTAFNDTAPNSAATISDVQGNTTTCTGGQGGTEFTSPTIAIPNPPAGGINSTVQLRFRNNYNLEANFDGGVLELSINGGPFQDIIAAGGSFVSGGYVATLGVDPGNPLSGRNAWTGSSGGFITTLVNLPASTFGQNVQFKWRTGNDGCVTPANAGMRIDTISIVGSSRVCTSNCGGVRLVVTSTLTRINPARVRASYTIQNTGTLPANNTMLTTAKLGSTNGTPLPQSLGNIAPGGSASGDVDFTNMTPGAASILTLGGTYTGGSFSASRRVTIP